MAIPKKVLKIVQARDDSCWHCGREDDLVPHHRINRGMGGSKLLDTPDNLMMVCAVWNGLMESNAKDASTARGWGHKLAVWDSTDRLVFYRGGGWWQLLADGSKISVDVGGDLF